MENVTYCQSCGIPLQEGIYGTEHDGTENKEYYLYCYKHGAFVDDCTMEDMIAISVDHLEENGMMKKQGKTREETKAFLDSFFPELKRWKK